MIVICGVPQSGKTSLSRTYEQAGKKVFHTDVLISDNWSKQSQHGVDVIVANNVDVIEGTTAVRALRKYVNHNPGKPCDLVIWMDQPRVQLTKKQEAMGKGCRTMWSEIYPDLKSRGVRIQEQ